MACELAIYVGCCHFGSSQLGKPTGWHNTARLEVAWLWPLLPYLSSAVPVFLQCTAGSKRVHSQIITFVVLHPVRSSAKWVPVQQLILNVGISLSYISFMEQEGFENWIYFYKQSVMRLLTNFTKLLLDI
jgi:hypothetical protein